MMNVDITAQNLVEQLRLVFPAVEDRYQEELRSWNGDFPGNYNVFAFVFKPFLQMELARDNNRDLLVRLCGFMERVCVSHDKEAINVLWLKVFKLLLADAKTVKRLWPLMGPATKANLADAALRWGLVRSVPAVGLVDGLKHWAGLATESEE
jgi:hypothetical protein